MIRIIPFVHYKELSSFRERERKMASTPRIIPKKSLKPQQEWGEIIAIYLYLAGMGAGSFIVGILIHWMGVTLKPSAIPSVDLFGIQLNLNKIPILWGPVMVAIAAPFLILDLGIKWRFPYACLNPRTSWVARGFIILSVFILFGLAIFFKSLLPFPWLYPESRLWFIPEMIAFVSAFATALYTGILLKATRSVPLWNTPLLPLLFLASALSTGSMSIILSTLGAGLLHFNALPMKVLLAFEQALLVVEGFILYLFLLRGYRSSEQGKDSVHLMIHGRLQYIFWQGIVVLGFLFPITFEWLSKYYQNITLLWMAGLSLLTGGFFLRLCLLRAGIKERLPMQRLLEIRYGMKQVC